MRLMACHQPRALSGPTTSHRSRVRCPRPSSLSPILQQRQASNGRSCSTSGSAVACSASRRDVLAWGLGPCCACGCAAGAPRKASWYDKYFAYNMAYGMDDYENAIAPVKRELFTELLAALRADSSAGTRSLLELGVGTGTGPVWRRAPVATCACLGVHGRGGCSAVAGAAWWSAVFFVHLMITTYG